MTDIPHLLNWRCNHIWKQIGLPQQQWTSDRILLKAPVGTPYFVIVRCELCQGETDIHLGEKESTFPATV